MSFLKMICTMQLLKCICSYRNYKCITQKFKYQTRYYSSSPYVMFTRDHIPDETLFLIDGTSIIFKSYFSSEKNNQYPDAYLTKEIMDTLQDNYGFKYAPHQDSSSTQSTSMELVNTVYGHYDRLVPCGHLVTMASQFAQLIKDVKPKYLAVIFDASSKTFRNDMYQPYKQQRPERPPEMGVMFKLAPRIFELFGCKCIKQFGYEADDVMATLSTWGKSRGLNIVHVSVDKDMLQLVAPGVHVYNPKNREYFGENDVIQTLGLPPSQLCDYWALTGDTSDNIPGVPGAGPKTALALIKYFHTIENMIAQLGLDDSADSVKVSKEIAITRLTAALQGVRVSKDKLYTNLKTVGKDLLLFKTLVTLRDDVSLTSPSDLGYEAYSDHVLRIEKLKINQIDSMMMKNTTEIEVISVDNTDMEIQEESIEHASTLDLSELTTQYFRYRGERESAEVELKEISPHLMTALGSLRYSYRYLDRQI